ncbi:MAG: 50S ribosomal protein L32 [Deltaproteobacteria bacterium]|jgi:large subunit ribosomal protein L32|nr:50S ribosomal protein L32 [Deltaproteobacteria bacterium]
MAVPKRRQSKMKGRQRRTHYTAISPTLSKCPKCGEFLRPHTACPTCGQYRGRVILTVKTSKREEERAKAANG